MTTSRLMHNLSRRIVALTLFVLCAMYLRSATGFSFGSWSNPKSGFLPTITGVLGVLLAGANLWSVWRSVESTPADFGQSPPRAILFLAGLAAYVVLLTIAGYPASTFLVALWLLKIGDVKGWLAPLAISFLFTAITYALFGYVLKLSLP
jgi:hypothetical protein